jgi:hypothetical protein
VKEIMEDRKTLELFADFKRKHHYTVMYTAIQLLGDGENSYGENVSVETVQAIVKELVNAGADVNELGCECADCDPCILNTPLWQAIHYENLPLCETLIELGADVNFSLPGQISPPSPDLPSWFHNPANKTALGMAVQEGPQFVALLLKHNA